MEERIIKSGWVQKRSAYLKQWRRRWLVMRETNLCTYKTKDTSQKSTMNLPISEITEAIPSVLEIEKDFCFKIVCNEEYYITVDSDKELCLWLNLINHIRMGRNISLFDAPHFSRESKAMSDESLITSFSHTKSLINQREELLLNTLLSIYETYKVKAEEEHKILNESLTSEIENCRIVAESLSSDAGVLHKIQQIQRLTRDRQNFRPFDNINEAKLGISLDPEIVPKLIRPNIKVALKSPAEITIRRTVITRALKWRYTGNRIDALSFSISHDIELIGIGICSPYKQGGQICVKEFRVLCGSNSNSPIVYRHNTNIIIKFNPEESVHRINIEKPPLIKSDTKYTVFLNIEGSHTYKCVDCYPQVEGQVVWKFFNTNFTQSHQTNRCDITCGPIADFHYIIS
ncbi:hypothetical protein SteCoe_14669 [Stentor coeruleus]|uniref:PH domain-containing protein n=1 Tax=Stentor coeruleus TaxID=5963 RepID=A0A1R2C5E7_9CILI|nr:hypothetical protein SteCoe_14669 [Stentor coeruleus]